MLEELGISAGTAIIVLIALYLVIKWAVRKGIEEAYEEILDKESKGGLDKFSEESNQK